jgi:MoxR-like ATPase
VLDTVLDVAPTLDPAQLVALQRQVKRIEIEQSILDYIIAIGQATRSTPSIALGLSTRGLVALGMAARARAFLRGRDFVLVEDVLDLAVPVVAHRIRIAAYAEGFTVGRDEAEVTIRELVARIPLPI